MKLIYVIALIVGGSVLAWFLWRKVEPKKQTAVDKTPKPSATITDATGNVKAFAYKPAPNAGLLSNN